MRMVAWISCARMVCGSGVRLREWFVDKPETGPLKQRANDAIVSCTSRNVIAAARSTSLKVHHFSLVRRMRRIFPLILLPFLWHAPATHDLPMILLAIRGQSVKNL